MVIGEFLCWNETAKLEDRKSAAAIIARATCDPTTSLEDRCAAEAALTLLMDDPSPAVRRAISEQLSLLPKAPAHLIQELAKEPFAVSAPVLARCALSDALLKQRVLDGCPKVQVMIANRTRLSEAVTETIAREATLEAGLLLIANSGARLNAAAIDHLIARFGSVPEMRGALCSDPRLSLVQRQALVDLAATAIAQSPFVQSILGTRRAERITETARANAPLTVVDGYDHGDIGQFAAALREEGRVTTGLVLRALTYGRIEFFAAILRDLSSRRADHVQSVLVNGTRSALEALLRECGFGAVVRQLCTVGIMTWRDIAAGRSKVGTLELAHALCVLAENAHEKTADNDDLPGLLRTIYGELARMSARGHAVNLIESEIEKAKEEVRVAQSCVAVLDSDELLSDVAILELLEDEELPDFDSMDIDDEIDLDLDLADVADPATLDPVLAAELDEAFSNEFSFILSREARAA